MKESCPLKTMMRWTAVLSCFGLFGCEKKIQLDTPEKKASYAIGQQIGNSFKNQGLSVDPKVFARSISDALEGKTPLMNQDEQRQAIVQMQMGVINRQTQEGGENEKVGKAFLEKNKGDKQVKTTSSGLQYIILTEGKGAKPKATSTVKVHYKGYLTNNEVFDSSYDRGQPAEFPLNQVIKGWTEGLQLIAPGGKIKLFVPPDLGYGMQKQSKIPPGSVLIFEVELLEILK